MLSKSLYRQLFTQEHSNISLFMQPWWLDATSGKDNWDVVVELNKSNMIVGALPFCLKKKMYHNIITTPPLSPYLGPVIYYPESNLKNLRRYSFEHKVISNLLKQLPKHSYFRYKCNPSLTNWLPFYKQGYSQSTRYTYTIQDIKNTSQVYSQYQKGVRESISKAEKCLTLEESYNSDHLYSMLESTFSHKNATVPYSKKLLTKLITSGQKQDSIFGIRALDKDSNPHAHLVIFYDKNTAYSIVLGSNPKYRRSGAVQLLFHKSIIEASKRVNEYNFAGSMLPQIEPMLRRFGGEMTPYFQISKWENNILKNIYRLYRK